MLSKKYYSIIANIIKESDNKTDLIYRLSEYFVCDNCKFDRERFLAACNQMEAR